jgi:UDP-GlcNAc:undecaprenyl-phosphate GlcNAc-1-phosphate transferase
MDGTADRPDGGAIRVARRPRSDLPMPNEFYAFAAAVATCLILTPLVRRAALRWGLVDCPDGRRKVHPRPIPVAGGLAVLLTTGLVLVGVVTLTGSWRNALGDRWLTYVGLAAAAGVIGLVGVIDDYRKLSGRHKLAGQVLAVAVVMACGVDVSSIRLFDWTIPLGILAVPFTAFWLLGAINSLNLIDGMDGLLGSLGFIICGSIAVMAHWNQQVQAAFVATAMAGALLGFLFFNFPPASIFLGDCGSMLIGLVVGVLAIESSLKGPATVALAIPAAMMVIPIFDTSAAIIRRKLTGRSIYTTDRGHLHHCLQRRGLSNRKVIMLVGGLSLFASFGAYLSLARKTEVYAVLCGAVVVGLLVVFRLFGHAEFLLLKERLLAVCFAIRHGSHQGRVHQLEVRLQGSADWNDLWKNVTAFAEQIQLMSVCLDVNAPAIQEGYHARWGKSIGHAEHPALWRADMPLSAHGQVVGRLEVSGLCDGEPVWEKVALVAKVVEDVELAVAGLTAGGPPPTLDPAPAVDALRLEGAHTT